MNRLSEEKSPYLLMHSQNPVDWYAWSDEAFSKARETDKPIFLSIGYSSCHWCHVIAHESFEDEQIARLLNGAFIAIKVDKEERPDVDAVYMDAVELETGSGGWPMTLLLTPDGAPFYAATYLPKEALRGLLSKAAELWQSERPSLMLAADTLLRRMRENANTTATSREPSAALLSRAVSAYADSFDEKWGGFGGAPKFPSAHSLLFLLAHHERTGNAAALSMAEKTLDAMRKGGICDCIGGGFCRYSVDRKWLIPHFEKMLYDNALLLWAYARAWEITKKPEYRDTARATADYILREMIGMQGEFCCSQDADSEGAEGAYYLFTPEEIFTCLGEEPGKRFCDAFGITEEGNFEGKSVPNRIDRAQGEYASGDMDALRERVYEYRRDRLPLNRDDKVLTSWNGLAIAALCEAARALEEPRYLYAARRAGAFLREHMIDGDGNVLLRWRDGEAKGTGVLADAAYSALAYILLYRSAGDAEYRALSAKIARNMLARFADADLGGLYLYANDAEALVTRPKEIWDGAMPSGNSCAALALILLSEAEGDVFFREKAKEQLRFLAGAAWRYPTGCGFALYAMETALSVWH